VTATQSISLLPIGFSTASVSCPAGTVAEGGGYTFSSNIISALLPVVSSNAPVGGGPATGPTGWAITYPVGPGLSALLGANVTVYAVCSGTAS
jgi:hypothetical protein